MTSKSYVASHEHEWLELMSLRDKASWVYDTITKKRGAYIYDGPLSHLRIDFTNWRERV